MASSSLWRHASLAPCRGRALPCRPCPHSLPAPAWTRRASCPCRPASPPHPHLLPPPLPPSLCSRRAVRVRARAAVHRRRLRAPRADRRGAKGGPRSPLRHGPSNRSGVVQIDRAVRVFPDIDRSLPSTPSSSSSVVTSTSSVEHAVVSASTRSTSAPRESTRGGRSRRRRPFLLRSVRRRPSTNETPSGHPGPCRPLRRVPGELAVPLDTPPRPLPFSLSSPRAVTAGHRVGMRVVAFDQPSARGRPAWPRLGPA